MHSTKPPSRRALLQMLLSGGAITAPLPDHGLIKPPVAVPAITAFRHDGSTTKLTSLLMGHATALQLMFTNCQTTCPMQGAIFESVQRLLPAMGEKNIQLVSLSIDPAQDTPAALAAWLRHFHAGPSWIAMAPQMKDLRRAQDFFGRGRNKADDHSTQVHIVNRQGRLVWRTIELPAPEEIANILAKL